MGIILGEGYAPADLIDAYLCAWLLHKKKAEDRYCSSFSTHPQAHLIRIIHS